MKFNTQSNSVKINAHHSFLLTLALGISCLFLALRPAVAATYLFLTQSNADKVSAVSLSGSNYTITDILSADGPNRIAMSPDARRAYVTDANEGKVSVINATANPPVEIPPRITVAQSPGELAVSPNGERVYVVHQTNGMLYAINTNGGSIAFMTNLDGTQCKDVLVSIGSQANTYIYVANFSTGFVNIVDSSGNRVADIPTVGGTGGPRRLAITPDGQYVLATDNSSNMVTIIRTSDNSLYREVPVGNAPRGIAIAVTPEGTKTFVTNIDDHTVSVIDNDNDFAVLPNTIPVGTSPWQIVIAPNQNYACVSNSDSNSLTVFSTIAPFGIVKLFTSIGRGPFQSVMGPNGYSLYVANSRSGMAGGPGTVSVINLNTLQVMPAITGLGSKPFDLVFNVAQ